jgi:hypothetical protein
MVCEQITASLLIAISALRYLEPLGWANAVTKRSKRGLRGQPPGPAAAGRLMKQEPSSGPFSIC